MVDTAERPFGALLRDLRIAAGLSQEALAERASMSADGIGALERGVNRTPQRETLALLVRALQLTPEQQRALEAAALKAPRPRAAAARSKKHNMPRPLKPLFGRERELEDVRKLVKSVPLVTLTGSGGVGKTRLAVETGFAVLDSFEHGVWFVDLAPARDGNAVVRAVAEVFGVRERVQGAPIDDIGALLAHKNVLMILDNCEQVANSAAKIVEALCNAGSGVAVLATSRQPLHVAGEQAYRVASLDLGASVTLFNSAATRADPSFHEDESELPIVRRICEQLDGIALAIELAAARVKLLSLTQIEERLSERFRMLSGGGTLARHQTMRALIDWSYDLLSASESVLLARLGVFPADFSLEAATAVCSDEPIEASSLLDVLGSLVDKSLVISERRGHHRRFRLLETMRAYAIERLGDDVVRLRRRHMNYYLSFAEANATPDGSGTLQLEEENENFRRSFEWAIEDGSDPALGARLLWTLREFLLMRGLAAASARLAERVLASTKLPPLLEARTWEIVAAMRGELLLPVPALEAATQAHTQYEALGDRRGIARVARSRGIAHLRLGMFDEAERDLRESAELTRELGDERESVRALGSMAVLLEMTGRFEEAREVHIQALYKARVRGDERLISVCLLNLAEAEFGLGNVEAAIDDVQEILVGDSCKNPRLRGHAESNLSAYLIAAGRYDQALTVARSAVAALRHAGDRGLMACALGNLAAIIARSNPTIAARLLGFVDAEFAATGYRRENTETKTYRILMEELEKKLDGAQIGALRNEGASMTEDQAVKCSTAKREFSAKSARHA